MPLPDPSNAPTSLVAVLVVAVVTLAGVIVYLFRYYSAKADQHAAERLLWAKEREAWAVEREKTRTEFERQHREVLHKLYDEARQFEATSRREYAQHMEAVEQNAAAANERIGKVLEKIYERFISPRRASH